MIFPRFAKQNVHVETSIVFQHVLAVLLLTKDSLEARAEAVETIIHSLKDGKVLSYPRCRSRQVGSNSTNRVCPSLQPNLKDAQEELLQKFGIQLAWKQHLENEEAKRQRRCQSHQKKVSNRGKGDFKLAKVATSLESLPGVPSADEEGEGISLPRDKDADGESQYQLSSTLKEGMMTTTTTLPPSKRPASSQEPRQILGMKAAKKAKSSRELIVFGASDETEEKPRPKSAAGLGDIISDNHNENASSGSPDQEIVDLLGELDEVDEEGSEMGSDDEFDL